MPRPLKDITDAELAVLQRLWEDGPATIRQLTEQLYPGGGTSEYSTVQKLLDRLEEKRCVRRHRDRTPHRFEALLHRDELIGRRLRTVAEKLCGGSVTPLLTHLVRAEELSAEDRQELRDLIDELDAQEQLKRKKKPHQ